jgi:hypothetical protein
MLIPDKTILDEYLSVNADLEYEAISPELKRSDNLFILDPLYGIGQEFYNEITQVAAPNTQQAKVLDLLRSATADYAYTIWARMHSVNNSNSGITVTRNENSAPVSDAKLEGIIAERKRSAYRFLELVLEYLEKNADTFSTWKNSSAFTIRKELFVSSVSIFERYCFINQSRMVYMQLKPYLLQAEVEMVKPELGEDLYTLIKAEYQAGTLKSVHLPLVEYAQRITANYAMGLDKKD